MSQHFCRDTFDDFENLQEKNLRLTFSSLQVFSHLLLVQQRQLRQQG